MTKPQPLLKQLAVIKEAKAMMNDIQSQENELPTTIEVARLSNLSQDVLASFGVEAPGILNHYACAVEDALISQVRIVAELRAEIQQLKEQLQQHS